MATVIKTAASTVAATVTGRSTQRHIGWAANQGAWWAIWFDSTQSLSAIYSANGTTWSTPTGSPFSLTNPHGSEGRRLACAFANIASTDVLHCELAYAGGSNVVHHRFTLGSTMTRTANDVISGSYASTSFLGFSAALDSANKPYGCNTASSGDGYAASATNADLGSSWTSGFNAALKTYNGETQFVSSSAIFSIGSGNMMWIGDNSPTTSNFTQLFSNTSAAGVWGSTVGSAVFGSLVTSTSTDNWSAVSRGITDIHVVALSDNSSNYVHRRWNGTSWGAGDAIPTLAYGASSGIALVTDGTNVWALVIDTSKNIKYSKWISGTGWSAWTVLDAARANVPTYITAAYDGTGNILAAWTETNGSNYDLLGSKLSTSVVAPTTATLSGPTSGNVGAASTAFTITLDHPATVSCSFPITYAATVTTSPVVIGIGASTGTFTVTPSSAGANNVTLGAGTTGLTIAGSPISYTGLTSYDLTNSSVYGHYVQIEGGGPSGLATNFGTLSWCVPFFVSSSYATEGAIRFRATIGQLDVHCYLNGSPVRLTIDRVDTSVVTLANTSAYGWATISSSLDSANEHEYLLSWGSGGNFGLGMYVDQIRTTGGTGLNTANLTARPTCAFFGDSITFGIDGPGDATLNWTHLLSLNKGWQVANRGIGSTGVYFGGSSGQTRTADITGITPAPGIVCVMYGVNDIGNSTQLQFTNAYTAMLTALRTGLPSAWLVCEAILHDGANNAAIDTYNGYIQTAVTGQANARTIYRHGGLDNYNTINGGLHPNVAGSIQVANGMAPDFSFGGFLAPNYNRVSSDGFTGGIIG